MPKINLQEAERLKRDMQEFLETLRKKKENALDAPYITLNRKLLRIEKILERQVYSFLVIQRPIIARQLIKYLKAYTFDLKLTESFKESSLLQSIDEGELMTVIEQVNWDQFKLGLTKILQTNLPKAFKEGALTEAGILKGRFTLTNPRAVNWIRDYSAQRVVQVTNETKLAIRESLFKGYSENKTVDRIAIDLRKNIGLTNRQSAAVDNYWRRLAGDGTRSLTRVNAMVDAYSRKKLRERAQNIARTETMEASSQGQQELWLQMGYEHEYKHWILTPDDRLCEHCAAMEGQEVPVTEPFVSPTLGIQVIHSPLHPSCRCSQRLVKRPKEDGGGIT